MCHRNTSIGYSSFDELYLESSQKNLFGFDSAKIGYGRYKVRLGGEEPDPHPRAPPVEPRAARGAERSLRCVPGAIRQGDARAARDRDRRALGQAAARARARPDGGPRLAARNGGPARARVDDHVEARGPLAVG